MSVRARVGVFLISTAAWKRVALFFKLIKLCDRFQCMCKPNLNGKTRCFIRLLRAKKNRIVLSSFVNFYVQKSCLPFDMTVHITSASVLYAYDCLYFVVVACVRSECFKNWLSIILTNTYIFDEHFLYDCDTLENSDTRSFKPHYVHNNVWTRSLLFAAL